MTLTDQVIDLLDERTELAIRVGPMRPSQLGGQEAGRQPHRAGRLARLSGKARDAAASRRPGRSRPDHLQLLAPVRRVALQDRQRTGLLIPPTAAPWWETAKAPRTWPWPGRGSPSWASSTSSITSGRAGLVPVLDDFNSGELETVSAVYVGHAGPLPARVRAFIDFLAAEVDVDWPDGGERSKTNCVIPAAAKRRAGTATGSEFPAVPARRAFALGRDDRFQRSSITFGDLHPRSAPRLCAGCRRPRTGPGHARRSGRGRMRPTNTGSWPVAASGFGTSSSTTPGAAASSAAASAAEIGRSNSTLIDMRVAGEHRHAHAGARQPAGRGSRGSCGSRHAA